MVNYEGPVRAQVYRCLDDDDLDEECSFRLMPFHSDEIEKAFQDDFNKEQALWDILQCVAIVVLGSFLFLTGSYIRATELAPGVTSLPNIAALYASVGMAIVVAALAQWCTEVYVKWRMPIILAFRALLAHNVVVLFYMSSLGREQPLHWFRVLVKIGIYMSRVLMPLLQFMTFQVPITGWFLMTQCTMLAYFMQNNELECRTMVVQPSLRRGLNEFLGFWREVSDNGGTALCSSWCTGHAAYLPACNTICPPVLETFWSVVGRPSIQMCVNYRVVVETLFGFAAPLTYVYIHQIMARRRYAKSRHLPEADVPFFHARSSKLLILDAVLILGTIVGQCMDQPLHLLG